MTEDNMTSQQDERRVGTYEEHFSDELWQLTLRNFDMRKEEAFRKIRVFGKHCKVTLAGIVQRYVDGTGDQLAFDVMTSLCKENYGNDEQPKELESGDIHVQSYGCGVVLIKVRDDEVKKLLVEKEAVDFYKTLSVNGDKVERKSGKVFIKDIHVPTVRLQVSGGEIENKAKIDEALRKCFRELMGDSLSVKIEDKVTEIYVNQRRGRKKFQWDKGDRVVTLSNFTADREGLLVDGPVLVNVGEIGQRELTIKIIGGKQECKSCGGLGCGFRECKNRCKYCLTEIGVDKEHKEETCVRRNIGETGSRGVAVMRRALMDEQYPRLDLTKAVEDVGKQIEERKNGAWRTMSVDIAKGTASKVGMESDRRVNSGTPLRVMNMNKRRQDRERKEERVRRERERNEELLRVAAEAEERRQAEAEERRQAEAEEVTSGS